ncbi:MAG: hypothetical protein ACK5RO_00250 [Pseudobdellovibrionaceae bacterium]
MTLSKRHVWIRGLVVIGVLGLIAISYQNCGQAGFEGSSLEDSSGVQAVDTKLSQLPFPYSGSINQVIYNSCPLSSNGSGVSWNFAFGAFDDRRSTYPLIPTLAPAGISVSSRFITSFKQSYQAVTDSGVRNAKFKEALLSHPSVENAQMFISIRGRSNPYGSRVDSSIVFSNIANNSVTARGTSAEYMPNLLPALNLPQVAAEFQTKRCQILGDSPCMREDHFVSELVKFGDPTQRYFSGSLGLGPLSNNAEDLDIANQTINNALLALAFHRNVDFPQGYGKTPIQSAQSSGSSLVGRGYLLSVGQPSRKFLSGAGGQAFGFTNLGANYPSRALEIIGDRDLEVNSSANSITWDCRSLRIVRPQDNQLSNGTQTCPKIQAVTIEQRGENSSSRAQTAVQREIASMIEALRRLLPDQKSWEIINPIANCAVPSESFAQACYRGSAVAPDYSIEGANCIDGYGPGRTGKICAHWLTLCLRR